MGKALELVHSVDPWEEDLQDPSGGINHNHQLGVQEGVLRKNLLLPTHEKPEGVLHGLL